MNDPHWLTIAIAVLTGINSWCQFLVKERLLAEREAADAPLLAVARSRLGVFVMGVTGVMGLVSAGLLVREVFSTEPLTRGSCVSISVLCVLVPLNLWLVTSLLTLRRVARLALALQQSEQHMHAISLAHANGVWFLGK